MLLKEHYKRLPVKSTLVISIPLFVFAIFLIRQQDQLDIQPAWPFISYLISDAGFLFLSARMSRFIGKAFLHPFVFKGGFEEVPAINYLLLKDDFLPFYEKMRIRKAIVTQYEISLPNPSEEMTNASLAKGQIGYAIDKMKRSLFGNRIVMKYEMEYKFMRNLIGGCFQAIVYSMLNIYLGYLYHDKLIIVLGFCCLIGYHLPLLFAKFLLTWHSKHYAMKLYREFLHAN